MKINARVILFILSGWMCLGACEQRANKKHGDADTNYGIKLFSWFL